MTRPVSQVNLAPEQSPWRLHAACLVGYLLLALWLTWPTALHLTTHYFTSGEQIFFFPSTPDAAQNIWNMWWTAHALREGLNPFETPLLFYPEGIALFLHTLNIAATLPMVPVTLVFGPVAAYNIANMLSFLLCGYAGFLLARQFGASPIAAFIAGGFLTATPFHVAKFGSGQINFVTLHWGFFAIVALIALTRQTHLRQILLAALMLVLTVLTDWYVAFAIGLFAIVWGLIALVRAPQPGRIFAALAGCAALSLVLLAPFGWAMAQALGNQAESEVPPVWSYYIEGNSSDALGMLFPAALNPLWGVQAEQFVMDVAPLSVSEGSYTAIGWVFTACALLGLFWYARQHWRLALIALIGWALSLGPVLYFLGQPFDLPMPYQLLQQIPALETARRPNIFAIITMASLAIFAGLAMSRLHKQLGAQRGGLVLGLVGLLALGEVTAGPRYAYTIESGPVFEAIAERPGVVLDLPIEGDTNSRTLVNQITHGQPILRGYVARPHAYPTLSYAPLPQAIGSLQPLPDYEIVDLSSNGLQRQQCYYRFRHLVRNDELLSPDQQQRLDENLQAWLGSVPTPWYQDERQRAYELPLSAEACRPFAFPGAGWSPAEQSAGNTWRWSSAESQLFIVNPAPEPRTLQLSLRIAPREGGQQFELWRGEEVITTITLEAGLRTYHLALELPHGMSQLNLRTETLREAATERDLGVMVFAISVE